MRADRWTKPQDQTLPVYWDKVWQCWYTTAGWVGTPEYSWRADRHRRRRAMWNNASQYSVPVNFW